MNTNIVKVELFLPSCQAMAGESLVVHLVGGRGVVSMAITSTHPFWIGFWLPLNIHPSIHLAVLFLKGRNGSHCIMWGIFGFKKSINVTIYI